MKTMIVRSAVAASTLTLGHAGQPLLARDTPAPTAPWLTGQPDASPRKFVRSIEPTARLSRPLAERPMLLLEPVHVEALLAEDAQGDEELRKPLRAGVGRDVQITPAQGEWRHEPGVGYVWALDVVSFDAEAVRVRIDHLDLPPGAELCIRGPLDAPDAMCRYTGAGPRDGEAFWSRTIMGDQACIELFLPERADAKPDLLNALRIGSLQHLYRNPLTGAIGAGRGAGPAGACHNDITCTPSWAMVARAVAKIYYVDDSDNTTRICTGTMMNSNAFDHAPFFLTADHCISSQNEAQSMDLIWDYNTATCNGVAPDINTLEWSSDCTLLASRPASDMAFLMIDGVIPRDQAWAGWISNAQPVSTDLACIHHPSGDFKRLSFGLLATDPDANYIRSEWYSGVTESGSSGSALIRRSDAKVIGQLFGGPSSCASQTWDKYGSLNKSWPTISNHLTNGGSDDGFEPNDTCTTFTMINAGDYYDLVVKDIDEDWYAILVPAGEALIVDATFTHAWGDLDIEFSDTCSPNVNIAAASSSTDDESLVWVNNGATRLICIRIFLYDDTRQTYDLSVAVGDPPGGGFNIPINNDPLHATHVNEGNWSFNTANATIAGDLIPVGPCAGGDPLAIGPDVWYTWQANELGVARISIGSINPAEAAPVVLIYDTVEPGPPTTSPLACLPEDITRDGELASVDLKTRPGRRFLIRIAGQADQAAQGVLSVFQHNVGPHCPGDTNGDGNVDFTDLNAILSLWGQTAPAGDLVDQDGDGAINFEDLNIVLANWAAICN